MPSKPHDDPSYPVRRSESDWQASLEPIEYQVTRKAATERAFTGRYWDHWQAGQYRCVCCQALLFESGDKFDAGCGWPSYSRPAEGAAIENLVDVSHGMVRTEVRCQQCGAHLGHVFEDGPAPTGLRYCINSAAIQFADPEDPSA